MGVGELVRATPVALPLDRCLLITILGWKSCPLAPTSDNSSRRQALGVLVACTSAAAQRCAAPANLGSCTWQQGARPDHPVSTAWGSPRLPGLMHHWGEAPCNRASSHVQLTGLPREWRDLCFPAEPSDLHVVGRQPAPSCVAFPLCKLSDTIPSKPNETTSEEEF